jgi:cell division protease FtsH
MPENTRPEPQRPWPWRSGKAQPRHTPWRTEGLEQPDGNRPGRWRRIAVIAVLGYWMVFTILQMQDQRGHPTAVAYTEFTDQVAAQNVSQVFARGDTIQGELKKPKPVPGHPKDTYTKFNTERPTFAQDNLLEELRQGGATVKATPVTSDRGVLANLLLSFGPIALLVAFYLWMFRRQQSSLGGLLGGGKKRPVDPEKVRVDFEDVAGIDEVENEIVEIVDFLKEPDKYRRLGARVPRGVLLAGPPGTGKTLLARATAGEAGVPFFSASASEFIEMVVGVGASRVRELFSEARKVAPSIIFIDEIDTIGRARGGTSIGGHDEREQTLNQILTEMDGFSGAEGVVVMAATNRADVLDPALLRPGRFDRIITVSPPDQRGRLQILQVHVRGVPLDPDVDLDALARRTPGMTGAELANLVNEAALGAARRGADAVSAGDFSDALEKIQLGAARNVIMPEDERRRTAYHEAGHALLGMLLPGADPVRKVSIIPRGRALGVTLSTPESDRYGYDEEYLRGRIIGALGGMAAEDVIYGVVTTGSESDLETATGLARAMVGRWGMSERVGPVSVFPREGDARAAGASEELLNAVDCEVRRIIGECRVEAARLLQENRERLEGIVARLLVTETLDEPEIYAAAGIPRPTPTVPAAIPAPGGMATIARGSAR